MKRRAMLFAGAAACAALLHSAPVRAQDAKPAFAYGTADAISATALTVKGRGQNPTTTELKLTGDTRFGVVTRVEAAAIEVEALVAVAPVAAGEAFETRSLAFAKESAENPNAEAMIKALAFRVGMMRGPQGQGADAPKPIIGKIIAVEGNKLKVKAGDRTYAVTIAAQAQIMKAASAKNWEVIAQGNRTLAQYVEATKVATVAIKMPEPQPRPAN
ncbi:MAG: hypothetical protein HZB16_05540 [Armatimonadetes bacterium]|nr:hypothetical protein [Armatimonadota bacterium]